MNHDEHDKVWELLGKARVPKDRPFFAAKVVRAAMEDRPAGAGVQFWALIRRWLFAPAAAGACAALLFVVVGGLGDGDPDRLDKAASTEVDSMAELATAVAQTDEIDATIDALLAAEDNSVWLLDDPSSLY